MPKESLTAKFAYRIEPKPEGGFVARSCDASMPTIEGATAEEVKQKIQAKLLEAIGARLGSAFHLGSVNLNINGVKLHSTLSPTQSPGQAVSSWQTSSSVGPLTFDPAKLSQTTLRIISILITAGAILYWLMHR